MRRTGTGQRAPRAADKGLVPQSPDSAAEGRTCCDLQGCAWAVTAPECKSS